MWCKTTSNRFLVVSELGSINFYRETMSRDRFTEIKRFLRFDIISTRIQRLHRDKFALASEIWKPFIENCIACYKPNTNITIDEQLFPTRCRFLQYMAYKPNKFGIKFWLAVDVESRYLLNGFPYLGKDKCRPTDQSLSENIVLTLAEPFLDKGRNIITDNFFTSVSLAKKLKMRNTSLVGTVNRSRREIPPEIKNAKFPLYQSSILKHDNVTLTIYQGKAHKNVLLLSTMHAGIDIEEHSKKLSETIRFYNHTKFGLDNIQQKPHAGGGQCKCSVIYLTWRPSMHGFFIKKHVIK